MKQTRAWGILIALTAMLAAASAYQPYYITDKGNTFFAGFVTWELLSFLGVIVTITLASAASLHLELNKLQEATRESFGEARAAVRMCAYSLLILFAIAFVVVMVKPTVEGPHWNAALNSVAVLIVIFNLAILADLTMAVFCIPALEKPMTNLKKARDEGKLEEFIAEREASPQPSDGDEAAFNRALSSMAGKSKEAPAA
ncbi:hypothetical protein ACFOKI_16350 [Sphingomonas qilianensis]|uniref:Uncharacterized protein n=1 Tax=Sphingomonas qilianensis TaxID=1736690 RepID=A0ABU9XWM3_9SPHN